MLSVLSALVEQCINTRTAASSRDPKSNLAFVDGLFVPSRPSAPVLSLNCTPPAILGSPIHLLHERHPHLHPHLRATPYHLWFHIKMLRPHTAASPSPPLSSPRPPKEPSYASLPPEAPAASSGQTMSLTTRTWAKKSPKSAASFANNAPLANPPQTSPPLQIQTLAAQTIALTKQTVRVHPTIPTSEKSQRDPKVQTHTNACQLTKKERASIRLLFYQDNRLAESIFVLL
ncbi:hypothetical protein NEOLI_001505 [Neolecta irregularis DAH-3]|uniref:Uncharacterized protein n=1 Tax=Neolecta irregularis (strain DAH-3) TaxID=1198029 RepID=A0A1U7LW09_NEOID|nr:hypothetical protein NEOLI_001505 [Neolecta irregularis DAH-3]|eukprot:OLL26809.1 hypothetical protein NEOLI_001505 [Neolecta irregularis DAH-3]